MIFLEGVAEIGVDVLEMDAHMTRDGQIILMHDERVDRTTDGSGLIREMTLEELRTLEVGVNWSEDGGSSYPYVDRGLQVPTLREVFEQFPEHPMVIDSPVWWPPTDSAGPSILANRRPSVPTATILSDSISSNTPPNA